MKLPKGFGLGDGGVGGMMANMKSAMERAQSMEEELEAVSIPIDKGPVKATFDGTGRLLKITLDPSVVDPQDIEALEDLIVGVVKDGFEKAVEMRNSKVQEIMPNLPNIPGLNL